MYLQHHNNRHRSATLNPSTQLDCSQPALVLVLRMVGWPHPGDWGIDLCYSQQSHVACLAVDLVELELDSELGSELDLEMASELGLRAPAQQVPLRQRRPLSHLLL